jgi:hypothetical protein
MAGMQMAKMIAKKIGFDGLLTGGMIANDYGNNRGEGQGVVGAAANSILDNSLPMVMGFWPYAAVTTAMNAPGAILTGAEKLNTAARGLAEQGRNVPFGNTTFVDTEQIYTMRQAGMSLAQRGKYNIQQTQLGNEARSMHR